MSKFEVRELSPEEYSLWDMVVAESLQGTIFHSSGWVRTAAALTDRKPMLIGCFEGDSLYGGCTLYLQNYHGIVTSVLSVTPMTPYGGFFVAPLSSVKGIKQLNHTHSIVNAIGKFLETNYDSATITNSPEFTDVRPLTWNGWTSNVYYTYYLDCSSIFKTSTSRSVRNQHKRAEKNGITVRSGSDIQSYYALFEKTFAKQNAPTPVSRAFIERMTKMVLSEDRGEILFAETPKGETVSAIITVWDNKRAHGWSAASDPKYKDTGAHSLVLYKSLEKAYDRGFAEFNLMAGNMPQLVAFYSKYQPKLIPYFSVKKANTKARIMAGFNGMVKSMAL